MVDWQKSLRAYMVKKMSDILDLKITEDDVETFEFNDFAAIDLGELLLEELPTMYAFALMREDFETAKLIADEIESRNARITFDINEDGKTGQINLYVEPETDAYFDVKMIITSDGVIIDWEKQNF